jgi:hypothetical protein
MEDLPSQHRRLGLADFRTTDSLNDVKTQLLSHLNAGKPLETVLRGHLWIERGMNLILERVSVDESELGRARLTFAQKVAVLAALGHIEEDEAVAVRAVNGVRNRLAHDVSAELSKDEVNALGSGFSVRLRELAGPELRNALPERAFAQGIATIVVVLHLTVDNLDARKRYDAYLHQQAVEALRGAALEP